MLQIEIISTEKKVIGAMNAIIDFSNPHEVRAVIKSIREQHEVIMAALRKSEQAIKESEILTPDDNECNN